MEELLFGLRILADLALSAVLGFCIGLERKLRYKEAGIRTHTIEQYDEEDIERSILQQLLYSQKKYRLPNSEINRTNKTNILPMIPSFVLLIIFIFSTVLFACEMSGNGLFALNSSVMKIITIILSITTLSALIVYLAFTGRLRKVKYKDLEIGMDKDGKTPESRSLINKFIDEVL